MSEGSHTGTLETAPADARTILLLVPSMRCNETTKQPPSPAPEHQQVNSFPPGPCTVLFHCLENLSKKRSQNQPKVPVSHCLFTRGGQSCYQQRANPSQHSMTRFQHQHSLRHQHQHQHSFRLQLLFLPILTCSSVMTAEAVPPRWGNKTKCSKWQGVASLQACKVGRVASVAKAG